MNTGNPTIGEQRVRVTFNPSANDNVSKIKQMSAELINICEALKELDPRLASLAMTDFESGAMWAVKLATTGMQSTASSANAKEPVKGSDGSL